MKNVEKDKVISWENFYLENPYDGFKSNLPIDITGWNSTSPVFDIMLNANNLSTIIEVGSWKGASAINIVKILKEQGVKDPRVICIDTFLGSQEHWDFDNVYHSLKFKNGRPTLYEQFLVNVISEGMEDNIIPLVQTSQHASIILKKLGVVVDLIYVDGSHEYEDVRRDLKDYWSLLKIDGFIFGDDWGWEGVNKAVKEFGKEYEIYANHFWSIKKEE